MIRRVMPLAAACATILAISLPSTAEDTEMKVSRIALFSSGVGFFERQAEVDGNATAELKFRTDQINDILKSLVVQDLGGGTVNAVGYASRDPIEKTLKSFAVNITGKPTMANLLDQLRGEPVEITGAQAIRGVIVSVEKQKIAVEKEIVEIDLLNVLSDAGLQQLRVSDIRGIKLTNEKLEGELRKALETLAGSHEADKKGVTIEFAGQGKRLVRAAYLLEAPIWKTSYRLVLAPDKKPFLQGWATVENATEEDWKDVRLSLVSGRPISFTMDLYTPLYVPRPKEELELYASLRPPTLEAGVPLVPAAPPAPARRAMAASKAPEAREEAIAQAGAARARTAGDAAGRYAAGTPVAMSYPNVLELADHGVQSVAQAQSAGELFKYVINTPVSIARQRSAMLSIVNQEVSAEKVSIFNPATHPKHPLNGFILENTTDLNLMQGPITVFDENVYAGDAKLPDLKPAEKRLLAYALDLSAEVIVDRKPQPDDIVSLRIVKGILWHKHKHVDTREYTIRNKDKKDREVIIEQPYTADWTLIEPKEPFERTQSILRFKTSVPAGQTIAQKVQLERVSDQTLALIDSDQDAVRFFLRSKVISPAVKQALEKVIALRSELYDLVRARELQESELKKAVEEQARIRENLKTLQQGSDPYQRQLKKFDDVETQIEKLKGQVSELRQTEENKRKELEAYILSLDVE